MPEVAEDWDVRCPHCKQVLDPRTDIQWRKGVSFGWYVFACGKCSMILSVGS